MGKCIKCGKKIEYNAYFVIDEKIYCPKCGPNAMKKKPTIKKARVNRKAAKGLFNTGTDIIVVDLDQKEE